MNLAQLTSADLKHIASLLERREALQAQVEAINQQLTTYASGEPDREATTASTSSSATTPAKRGPISEAGRVRIAAAQKARWAKVKGMGTTSAGPTPAAAPAKAGRQVRGQLKESVVALVKAAGKSGITVAEIAAQLKAKPKNIFVWFNSTGKGVKAIKKVGRAKYGWVG